MREKAGKGQGNDANKKSNPTQWILKNLEEIDEGIQLIFNFFLTTLYYLFYLIMLLEKIKSQFELNKISICDTLMEILIIK